MGWFGLLSLLLTHRAIIQCNRKSSLQVMSPGVTAEIFMGFINKKMNVLRVVQTFWMGTKGYSAYFCLMK